jgi:hypothetical protein
VAGPGPAPGGPAWMAGAPTLGPPGRPLRPGLSVPVNLSFECACCAACECPLGFPRSRHQHPAHSVALPPWLAGPGPCQRGLRLSGRGTTVAASVVWASRFSRGLAGGRVLRGCSIGEDTFRKGRVADSPGSLDVAALRPENRIRSWLRQLIASPSHAMRKTSKGIPCLRRRTASL